MHRLAAAFLAFLFFQKNTAAQVTLTTSNLPILVLKTDGQTIQDEPKIAARLFVLEPTAGKTHLADTAQTTPYYIGIEHRGSTSQGYLKIGYALETRDAATGASLDTEPLGLPKGNDWVLVGPYNDKSLLRDAMAYGLAGEIMAYAPRPRLVEVVLNDDYQGVYLFTEKIKRDKNRVNISKLKTTDIAGDQLTGGYILKLDKPTGLIVDGWTSDFPPFAGTPVRSYFQYHYPKPESIAAEQKTYIQKFIFDMETMFAGPSVNDSLVGYPKFIDVDSWIDYLLVNEISKNTDGYRLSTFMYKNRDSLDGGRLKMGPVWDFNIAFGIGDYCEGQDWSGWGFNFNDVCPNDGWVIPFWWKKLLNDPRFRQKINTRWTTLRAGIWTNQNIIGRLDSMTALLADGAATRNFQRWPVLGIYVWPNSFIGPTWKSETEFLKDWLTHRLVWMDIQIGHFQQGIEPNRPIYYIKPQPNPARGSTFFDYRTDAVAFVRLELFDEIGRRVGSWPSLPTGDFAHFEMPLPTTAGLYFWKMILNDKQVGSGKIVVQP